MRQYQTSLKLGKIALERHLTLKFVFFTLTVPNVPLRGLSDAIDGLFESWRRLYQRKEVKSLCGSSFVDQYIARARARAGGIDLIYLEIIAYTSYLSSYCAGLSAFQIHPFGIILIQNARF